MQYKVGCGKWQNILSNQKKTSLSSVNLKDIQCKHQLQYTVLLQESAQALQAVVLVQVTPVRKMLHCQHLINSRTVIPECKRDRQIDGSKGTHFIQSVRLKFFSPLIAKSNS